MSVALHAVVARGPDHDMVAVYAGPDSGHLQICGMLSCTREQADRIIALIDPHDFTEMPWERHGWAV